LFVSGKSRALVVFIKALGPLARRIQHLSRISMTSNFLLNFQWEFFYRGALAARMGGLNIPSTRTCGTQGGGTPSGGEATGGGWYPWGGLSCDIERGSADHRRGRRSSTVKRKAGTFAGTSLLLFDRVNLQWLKIANVKKPFTILPLIDSLA
jgi:hypothetical protein